MTDWLNKDFNNTYGSSLGLNKFLMGTGSPINPDPDQNYAYKADADNERNSYTNFMIKNLAANKITAGTLISEVTYTGTINFDQAKGGTLVLGGTANGEGVMEIKNASGTTIVRGDNNGHHYYTDTGVEQIKVDEDGLTAYKADGSTGQFAITKDGFYTYGTTKDLLNFKETPSSTVSYGQMGYGSGGMWIASNTSKNIYIMASGNNSIFGDSGVRLFCVGSGGTALVGSYDGPVSIIASGSGHDVEISSIDDDVNLIASDDVSIQCGGDFKINGAAKTAIVPTSKGYKALFCVESPEVWFMDFCDSKDKIDPLFVETAVPPYKFIKCEDGTYQVWGRRKGFDNKRFEDKTVEDFSINNKIYSISDRRELDTKLQGLKYMMERVKPQQVANTEPKLDNTEEN